MNQETKAIALGACAVLSWSTVATAFKIAGEYMTPFQMVFVSSCTAFLILLAVLMFSAQLSSFRKITPRQWCLLAALGLLTPVAYYMVLFIAYDYLPAQVAQPLNYAWPIMLLILLSVVNHQSIPARKYIGMAVSMAGVACISLGGKSLPGGVSVVGVLFALASALLWAIFWVLNKRLSAELSESICLFGTFMFGSIYMTIGSCFLGFPPVSLPALLSGAYIGAFEMAIPFVCFGMALRLTTNPSLIDQMCYLSPFLSLFFISTVLGEPIIFTTYIGLGLIVFGLVYNQYFVKNTTVQAQ